ncbi:Importin [Phytophthora cactorum]|nr:Importin [Phytophthora cactorum]
MDISAALLNTQAPLRKQAEEFLNNALQQQMGQFMEFAVVGRQAAGLYLKNVLDAKDDALQQQKINAWMAMDAALRTQIKDGSLGVLQSNDPVARHTSAQLVAKIGVADPARVLLQNVTSGSEGCIHATLECLGYLCDELEEGAIDELDTNRILTAIVDGIRTDRPPAIRLAAITALRNSLEFVSENFKRKQERDHLMQKICEATQSPDLRTRVVAYECIAAIATMYYEYLAEYMETLCKLTFNAITSDQDEVGLQSLEFWSSMCDVELDLIEEMNYAQLENRTDYIPCNYYVQTVLNTLIPLLTETLKKQEDDQDEDSWNCRWLLLRGWRACVDLTMTFITQNIESNEWRPKEAAIMAFGSILDGPDSAKIAPLVRQALGFLMGCMKFDNILREMLPGLMQLLLEGLDQEPRVSHNVCYAIHNMSRPSRTVETSNRPNATESNLRGSAYEALNVLVQAGADEVNEHIMLRLPVVLERLEQSIKALIENPNSLHDDQAGLQALLCGVLIAAIQKLNTDIEPLADRIMQALLQVFSTRNAAAAEEAFMAAGALANVVGPKFEVYMQYFGPVVLMGLKNSEEYMVCSVAVGVVGDLCRSLEGKILPLCDEIVAALIEILKNPMLNRSVKPPVLSCFGDIALAIEGEYERYAVSSLQMILQAAGACGSIATDDEEVVEYMNQLRESVLEALTGIVQGLGAANKAAMLLECAPQIGAFLATLANDLSTRSDAVTTGAVGLIGDMGQAMGKAVETLFHQQFAVQLVTECANNAQNPQAQQLAAWTQKVIMDLQAN